MKIKDILYDQETGLHKYPTNAMLTYLVFGGQASVYITSLEYIPTKGQLKLKSGTINKPSKSPKKQKTVKFNTVRFSDLFIYPEDTEILIEGYPGDTPENGPEWETPQNIEFNENEHTLDFQRLLTDDEMNLLEEQMKLFDSTILSTLRNVDIPKEIVTKAIEELLNNY